jgi:hypothetical protein
MPRRKHHDNDEWDVYPNSHAVRVNAGNMGQTKILFEYPWGFYPLLRIGKTPRLVRMFDVPEGQIVQTTTRRPVAVPSSRLFDWFVNEDSRGRYSGPSIFRPGSIDRIRHNFAPK